MGLLPNTEAARQLDKLKIAFGKIIPKVEDILALLPNTENARQLEKLKIALENENGKIIEGLNENLKSQDNYLISCPHADAKLPEVCALAGSEPICWSPGMYLTNFKITCRISLNNVLPSIILPP